MNNSIILSSLSDNLIDASETRLQIVVNDDMSSFK